MQHCPQDQAAPQDMSTGGCRHQGVSLPQPMGTPRASPAGWMEGAAPSSEAADAWHERDGSAQLRFISTRVFSPHHFPPPPVKHFRHPRSTGDLHGLSLPPVSTFSFAPHGAWYNSSVWG